MSILSAAAKITDVIRQKLAVQAIIGAVGKNCATRKYSAPSEKGHQTGRVDDIGRKWTNFGATNVAMPKHNNSSSEIKQGRRGD